MFGKILAGVNQEMALDKGIRWLEHSVSIILDKSSNPNFTTQENIKYVKCTQ